MVKKSLVRKVFVYISAFILLAYILFPVYWMVISSFEDEVTIRSGFHFIPINPSLDNYLEIFGERVATYVGGGAAYGESIKRGIINSLIISLGTMILTLFVTAPVSYILTRKKFIGRGRILFSIWFLQTVPAMAILVSMYKLSHAIGLYDTLVLVIIIEVAIISPFVVWILSSFFKTIPMELEESAMIDGCSEIRALIKVILPLSVPGIATAMIYTFISAWNSFLYPLILTSMQAKPLLVAAAELVGEEGLTPLNLVTAMGITMIIPPVVIALVFQKLIIKGLLAGALRG